jgi:hypothetical protein
MFAVPRVVDHSHYRVAHFVFTPVAHGQGFT